VLPTAGGIVGIWNTNSEDVLISTDAMFQGVNGGGGGGCISSQLGGGSHTGLLMLLGVLGKRLSVILG